VNCALPNCREPAVSRGRVLPGSVPNLGDAWTFPTHQGGEVVEVPVESSLSVLLCEGHARSAAALGLLVKTFKRFRAGSYVLAPDGEEGV
jgi:hypothetical protein